MRPFVIIFLFGQPSFPSIVRPIEWAHIYLILEEVDTCTGHEGLMEVDNISLIVGGSQGILNQQLKPHSIIYLLNIITFTLTNTIKLSIIKLF